mgnify:FL=1
MADFETQVNGLTDLSIGSTSTSPSRDELSQFLKDGVLDVTNKTIALKSQDAFMFIRSSDEGTSQGALASDSSKVLTVVREAGVNDDWRDCTFIPLGSQSRVTDTDSLYFSSKYNPSYTIEDDGKVSVYPTPAANPNAYKIYFINGTPVDASGDALAQGASTIKYFPEDKLYLVVFYASMQSLKSKMASKSALLPFDIALPALPQKITIDTITTSLPSFIAPGGFVLPQAPADADISFTSVPTFPTFNKPVFAAPTLAAIGDLSLPSPPAIPDVQLQEITITAGSITQDSLSSSLPVYDGPAVAPNFSDVEKWITEEEDSEMAGTRLNAISAQIQEFGAKVQDSVQDFNEDNVKYQATLQAVMKNVDLKQQHEANKLQRFSQQLAHYQAEVNSTIQVWTNEEWTQKFQKYQTDYSNLLNEYSANVQNESARVGNNVQEYSQEIGKATQTYQAETGYDLSKFNAQVQGELQRFTQNLTKNSTDFQNGISKYSTEINGVNSSNNNKLSIYSAEVQTFSAEIQGKLSEYDAKLKKQTTDYQWLNAQHDKIKAQYDEAFMAMARMGEQQAQQAQGA